MAIRAYQTDLSDAEWSYIGPHLPAQKTTGRPRIHSLREILDAVFYVLKSGCTWRLLPHGFPPWKTVYHYFRAWRIDGTWVRLHEVLRRKARVRLERDPQPSAGIVDSQTSLPLRLGDLEPFLYVSCACNRKRYTTSVFELHVQFKQRFLRERRRMMTLSVEDRLEIMGVVARYNLAADEKDVEATLEHYAEDGQIEGFYSTGKGKEAMRRDLPAIFEGEGTLKRHLAPNLVIEGDEGGARVRYVLLVVEGEQRPMVGATARVTDEMARVNGRWLISRHLIDVDPSIQAYQEG